MIKLTFIVSVFFSGIENCNNIIERNFVVELDVKTKAAFFHVKGFNSFAYMVEKLGTCSEGEELTVKVEVDGDDLFFSANSYEVVKTVCSELGIDWYLWF